MALLKTKKNIDLTRNKDQSNLTEGGIAVASPLNFPFAFAMWQNSTDQGRIQNFKLGA